MNKKSLYVILAAAVVIGLLVLLFRIVSGAVSIVSGGFNAVLGLAVIAALVIIVIWMFAYAKKSRK